MQNVVDATAGIRIGQPMVHRNPTVFPLFGDQVVSADYVTLNEALAQKCAVVMEVSEGGSVPELKFVNSGTKRVFLLDGEQLIGAKQKRVLNLSILVAGGKVIIIPVTCVEAGRRRHRTSQFSAAPNLHDAQGRASKMAQVSESMRSTGQRRADQGKVWDDIRDQSDKFQVDSETSAMNDIFFQQSVKLQDHAASFPALDGQSGAVFAIDGQIVGLDLFDSAETLKKLLAAQRRRSKLFSRACGKRKGKSFPLRAKAWISAFPAAISTGPRWPWTTTSFT